MGLTIGALAGGTPNVIACHPEIIGAQLAVVADVDKELASLRVNPDKVLLLPLSRWGTVAALVEEAKACGLALSPALETLLPRLPNTSLEEGMGQMAMWGDLAMRVLEAKGLLEELKEQVFESALRIADGELPVVRILELESQAGGTGKGAGTRLAHTLVRTFLERSPATVVWEKIYIGNLTFVGLGKNVMLNAVHLWPDVAQILDGARSPREIRELWLTELPLRRRDKPIGAHKEQRDALGGALFQALFAGKVREEVGRRRSNRPSEHYLGALKTVRADFWDPLHEEQLLLAVATQHIHELCALEGKIPTEDLCKRVTVDIEGNEQWQGGHPKDIVELIQTSAEKPGLLQQGIWETPSYRGRVVAFLAENEGAFLDSLLRVPSPSSAAEYLRTRGQHASFRRVLTEELNREREKRAAADALLTEVKASLQRAISVLYPEGWWEKTCSILTALWPWGEDPGVVFERALSRYRDTATEALQSVVKVEALSGAIVQLDAACARYKGEIDRTVAFLRAFAQGKSCSTDLVVFASPDTVFARLLRASGAQDQDQLKQILRYAIGGVTVRGLAQIVGAKDADLREVLGKLATEPPPYRGPMWGGNPNRKPPRHRFLVLPPLEEGIREDVAREAEAAGLSRRVVEADTLVAGLTVVALEIYEVERIDEVLTELYEHYGKAALCSKRGPFFLIPGRDYEALRNGPTPGDGSSMAPTAQDHAPQHEIQRAVDEMAP